MVAAGTWGYWPRLQLARADSALKTFAAPHSLYWPGQAANATLAGRGPGGLAAVARLIEKAEARLGPTPRTFYLRGRIASQRGDRSEAIRLLRLAVLLDPEETKYQMAHGVALAIRGAAEHRAIDWAGAADSLLQAAGDPNFPALGREDLAPFAAEEYWTRAAALQPFFTARLQRAQAFHRDRKARIAEVLARKLPFAQAPGSVELLLQTALSEWLAKRAAFAPDLNRLAESLLAGQSDASLRDLLAAPAQPVADQALARAKLENLRGEYAAGAEAGQLAERLYTLAHNAAGQALSAVQAGYGLRRSARPKECLVEAFGCPSMTDKASRNSRSAKRHQPDDGH